MLPRQSQQTTAVSLHTWQQQFLTGVQAQASQLHIAQDCHQDALNPDAIKKRLQAYDNNYQLGLTKWLSNIYQQVELLVGKAYFKQLCHDFIDQSPLNVAKLFNYGKDFLSFLKTQTVSSDIPYLVDMAVLDWQIQQVYYAKNRSKFDTQAFGRLSESDQQNVIFLPADDMVVLASDYPLFDIWQLNQGKTERLVLDENTKHYCRIERIGYQVQVFEADAIDFEFYQAIQLKHNLSSLIELNTNFMVLINQWIRKGWIVGFI